MSTETENCEIVDVDGEPVRVHGNVGEWDDETREAFAEVVRAAKAKFAAEHLIERQADLITEFRLRDESAQAQLRAARVEVERLTKLHERHARNLSGVAGGNMSGYTVAEVEAVEAELAAERAKVQRVEALCDERDAAELRQYPFSEAGGWVNTKRIRRALAGGEQGE